MSNTAISEIQREALTVADDDLFVMSQKQPNGSHLTAKVKGAKLRGLKGDKGDKGDKGANGLNGEKGATGDAGISAYETWFKVNAGVESFLNSKKAIEVLTPEQIQELLSKTTLGLSFDDYLGKHTLMEFYQDLKTKHGNLTIPAFLQAAGLTSNVESYVSNYISTDASVVYTLFSTMQGHYSFNSSADYSGYLSKNMDDLCFELIDSELTEENRTQLLQVFPVLQEYKNDKGLSTNLGSWFKTVKVLDLLIFKSLKDTTFVGSSRVSPVLKFMDSRKSSNVTLADLNAYSANTVINQWIKDNTKAWFEQLPLLAIAKDWINR